VGEEGSEVNNMGVQTMGDIPPYQAVDIILGCEQGVTIPPVPGWVVTAPDSKIDTEMFANEADAQQHVQSIKFKSKWPDQIFTRPCWIHEQEGHRGGVSNRRHWTPR
jgi:hypothetical protein